MQGQKNKILDLREVFDETWQKLQIDEKLSKIQELEAEVAKPELWQNPTDAVQKNELLARMTEQVGPWQFLKMQLNDISELIELGDDSLGDEIENQINVISENFEEMRKSLRFNEQYDNSGAILRITAGVGGTEAMDWAGMLERMYLRFVEKKGFKVSCVERTAGEEAGIKTAVYEISGVNAYGWLKSEHGVHRLVRLSPFNADNLRQTSFALVEILPILPEIDDLKINEKDLRIDVYRAGGHGGQSVNTTDSAVRITHLPTGTVVAIQNERSQLQNREKAMEILRGKLVRLQQEQHAASINELRAGESASWGQQIRNYVMQPYKLVKDTRTKFEETDVEAVLNGKLENLVEAFLDYCATIKAQGKE